MAVVGVVATGVIFVPLAAGVAVGCYYGFKLLSPALGERLLAGVFLAIYAVWVGLPVLGYSINESYDITKLFVYPVSARGILVGAVLGSLIDLWVMLAAPVLGVVLISFSRGLAGPVLVLAALALFVFHALALTQAILLAGAGMLRSRRFRDAMIVLVPLLSVAFYVGYQYVFSRAMSHRGPAPNWSAIMQHPAWALADYTPPGFAARAIAAAGQGDYVTAVGFLLILAALCAATVAFAAWLVELVSAGHVVGRARRRQPAAEAAPARGGAVSASAVSEVRAVRAGLGERLPPIIAAMMGKEIRYLFREPYFKSMLVNIAMMMVIGIFAFMQPWRPSDRPGVGTGAVPWAVAGYVLFAECGVVFNLFGTEGNAAPLLFLFPSRRRQIMIGKGVVILGGLFTVNLAVVAILCAVAGSADMFGPLLAWMEIAIVVIASVGNVVSVLAPFRVVRRGWRLQPHSPGRGCAYALTHLVFYLVAVAFALPVLAAVLVPSQWVSRAWLMLTLPLAAGYAVGAYLLSLRLAEPMLMEREPQIIEALAPEEG